MCFYGEESILWHSNVNRKGKNPRIIYDVLCSLCPCPKKNIWWDWTDSNSFILYLSILFLKKVNYTFSVSTINGNWSEQVVLRMYVWHVTFQYLHTVHVYTNRCLRRWELLFGIIILLFIRINISIRDYSKEESFINVIYKIMNYVFIIIAMKQNMVISFTSRR